MPHLDRTLAAGYEIWMVNQPAIRFICGAARVCTVSEIRDNDPNSDAESRETPVNYGADDQGAGRGCPASFGSFLELSLKKCPLAMIGGWSQFVNAGSRADLGAA
jgi:hypothetical protein